MALTWLPLGTVTPQPFSWVEFPTVTKAILFRLTFTGNLGQVWYYAQVRQHLTVNETTRSIRVYPQSHRVIFALEFPIETDAGDYPNRKIAIAKFPARRWSVPDSNWQATLEGLK